ncbi:reverse transcriptase family protein [Luminiphilus sp.]|nr:reverse transcriptase family protein [Luminiphilus sp.]
MFETRESDGETVISSVGCFFVLLTLPLWLVMGAVLAFYERIFGKGGSNSDSGIIESGGSLINGWSKETIRRRQKRFLNKLGISAAVFWETDIHYKSVEIPKRSGGKRELSIPSDTLKVLQRCLVKGLEKELCHKVHKTANAYVKGRNTVTNAVPHLACAVLIKLDIKDFFPSVSRDMVKPFLSYFAYQEPQSVVRLLDLCVTDNGLPQGAPTSPILSNLVLRKFDIAAYQLANLMGAKYTRYADDLTFSLTEDDPFAARKIVGAVRSMLADHGFELNEKPNKLKILRGHQAQQICGITLNSGSPTISRKQRRKVRAARHALDNGLTASMSLASVEGWESYIHFVFGYDSANQ